MANKISLAEEEPRKKRDVAKETEVIKGILDLLTPLPPEIVIKIIKAVCILLDLDITSDPQNRY